VKILLVEDDEAVIALLTKSLTNHRFIVDAVRDGEMGWTYGSTFEYDLIVMDVMLPKLDGISLCQRFREQEYTIPILMLTVQDSSTARIQGLNVGADDYVIKPFDVEELIARIRALLRRCNATPSLLMSWGDLLLDPATCEVTYNGQALILTTKEYELIELLLQDTRHILSNDEILDRLWSSDEFPAEATVRSHIRRLRSKLQEVGAPADFISTMYGRGYYLKALEPTSAQSLPSSAQQDRNPAGLSTARDPQQNAQYFEFLSETWIATQPKCLAQTEILSQAVQALQADRITPQRQSEAHHIAHKLVGTLGLFGLTQGESIARRLETVLSTAQPVSSESVVVLNTLVTTLQQEIKSAVTLAKNACDLEQVRSILLVNADGEFTQSFAQIAAQLGVRCAVVPTLDTAYESLAQNSPDAIVLRSPHLSQRLEFLQTLSHHLPKIPILILGTQDELQHRLNVSRLGGTFLLEQSLTIAQMIGCAIELIQSPTLDAKIMFVDDDDLWLRSLPALLEPWRFKVTTLSDPQQFWAVLQSVRPDALVLDIKMPDIDGLELCQILRSDPLWKRLPVLFVSALEDPKTQDKAFRMGADDYLCKPIMGDDLANRIVNRLQRIRSWSRSGVSPSFVKPFNP
jgi:DNA-binding response OmpR family regulator/HPt (histidine-containing phosphotransfer) domain-containing protein